MKIPDFFTNPNATLRVAIAGAGGTGSFLASHLARLQNILPLMGRNKWDVDVYDDKDVSIATVSKQMFLYQEIGMKKCIALVERLNRTYNLNWNAVTKRLSQTGIGGYNLILGCTDSIEFRQMMMKKLNHGQVWLDAGCYRNYGQVIAYWSGKWPSYADLNMDNFVDHPDSCDALQSFQIQHPAINPLLASVMYSWLYDTAIYYNPPFLQSYVNLESMKMTSGMVFYDELTS